MDESVGTLFDCERLVEAIDDAIVVSDASGAIPLWNPAAGRLFGCHTVHLFPFGLSGRFRASWCQLNHL